MRPRFATGSGLPPRYVDSIDHARGGGGVIRLTGGTQGEVLQPFASPEDLMNQLRALAQQRVPFGVGEMIVWHGVPDSLRFPFLLIGFTNKGQKWSVHEINPGAQPPWEIAELTQILGSSDAS